MKFVRLTLATIAGCSLLAATTSGQTIQQPTSFQEVQVAPEVYYLNQEADPSPSDRPAELQPVKEDAKGKNGGKGCNGKGCGNDCGCSCYLFGPDEPFTLWPADNCHNITVGGWTQIGYHDEVTPLSTVRGEGASFNDVPDALNLHEQWLYIEKSLSGDDCYWDWGFRADIVYGTDAQKTQAFGTLGGWDNDWDRGVYGWAIPQAYVEVGRGPLSIKAGHFFTVVGYEVVPATGNFFYSHAYTMFNSEPFTHTGVLATYEANDCVTIYGGWTLGWDTGFRQFDDGNNWLGGVSLAVTDNLTVTYISTAGHLGIRGDNGYSHSIVADFTLTEKLNYVFQSDLVRVESTQDDDIGINQYLFYSYNDCLAFGTRVEWWKNEGNSFCEATFGVNYRPHANVVIRPEIRRDWHPFANFTQDTFGIDAILTY